MFGIQNRLASDKPYAPSLALEPYVAYFDARTQDQDTFIFPFQMMGYCMLFFLCMGFYFAFSESDSNISVVIVWLMSIFAPFYIPGIYHYAQYFARDRHTQLELDTRHEWIKYTNIKRGENLLFHVDQIEACQVNCSILFPYRIDYMTIIIQGGKKIHVSSLVVEPHEIISHLGLSYQMRRRWFNSAPQDWEPEPSQD